MLLPIPVAILGKKDALKQLLTDENSVVSDLLEGPVMFASEFASSLNMDTVLTVPTKGMKRHCCSSLCGGTLGRHIMGNGPPMRASYSLAAGVNFDRMWQLLSGKPHSLLLFQ